MTLPDMLDHDVEAILFRAFPRKISLMSPDDADDVIPELIAFWQYLQREFQLPNAEEIVNFLKAMDPQEFLAEMNNPANFGMAKSFFQGGLDMTTEEGTLAYQSAYNASLAGANSPFGGSFNLSFGESPPPKPPELYPGKATRPKKSKMKQKRRQALAKASRKQNRKKRK